MGFTSKVIITKLRFQKRQLKLSDPENSFSQWWNGAFLFPGAFSGACRATLCHQPVLTICPDAGRSSARAKSNGTGKPCLPRGQESSLEGTEQLSREEGWETSMRHLMWCILEHSNGVVLSCQLGYLLSRVTGSKIIACRSKFDFMLSGYLG